MFVLILIRIILDIDHADYNTRSSDLFCELEWMPLIDRIKYLRATQVYKCFKGLSPPDLQQLFTPVSNIHNHNTRSAVPCVHNNFHLPKCHVKSFQYLGIKFGIHYPL